MQYTIYLRDAMNLHAIFRVQALHAKYKLFCSEVLETNDTIKIKSFLIAVIEIIVNIFLHVNAYSCKKVKSMWSTNYTSGDHTKQIMESGHNSFIIKYNYSEIIHSSKIHGLILRTHLFSIISCLFETVDIFIMRNPT